MIHTINQHQFDVRDSVKVRQAQILMKLGKRHESGEIDEIDMAIETISALLLSINGDTKSENFSDWLKDNLDTSEMTTLSEIVMEIVNAFVKKNEISSTSTKPSSTSEAETSR